MKTLLTALIVLVNAQFAMADSVVAVEFQSIAYQAVANQIVKQHKIPRTAVLTSIASEDSQRFEFSYRVFKNDDFKCFKTSATVAFVEKGQPEVTFYRTAPVEISCK